MKLPIFFQIPNPVGILLLYRHPSSFDYSQVILIIFVVCAQVKKNISICLDMLEAVLHRNLFSRLKSEQEE